MPDTPISVLIPIRDKYDYRIGNCLNSIFGQTYPAENLDIVLIDYGSAPEYRDHFDDLVEMYNIRGIWTGVTNTWNKAHCLNIGIRHTDAAYVQVCDTDIIFAPDYFEVCAEEIGRTGNRMFYCKMMDTPEGLITREVVYPDEYSALLAQSVYRGDRLGDENREWPFGSSILFAPRHELVDIQGYDETYRLWGDEDWDVVKRLLKKGLPLTDLSHRTSHIHQWHSRFENVGNVEGFEDQVRRNREYFLATDSIVRNDAQWGKM